ncbi:MAG: hypothetical protein Q9187_003434, partial [Circinaria calcarea]
TVTSLTFSIDSTTLPSSGPSPSPSLITTFQPAPTSSSTQDALLSNSSVFSGAVALSISSSPNATASLFITTRVSLKPVTYVVSDAKPKTYQVRKGDDFDTFTITGPTTFVTYASLVDVLIASTPSNTTSTASYPSWDRSPYINYFVGDGTTWDAAQVAAASSFVSYGRQPACTAAYSSFIATKPNTTQTFAQVTTFTGGNGQITNGIGFQTRTRGSGQMAGFCCGSCSLYFNNVQVIYWPESEANTGCLKTVTTKAHSSATRSHDITPRAQPTLGSFMTGSDGFPGSTYPSAYVVFPNVLAQDACGLRGPNITSLTLALAPGELSSVVGRGPGPVALGKGTTLPFNFADFPCGPGNTTIINQFLPNGGQQTLYQPIIAAPSKLIDMEPLWKGCHQDYWQGQDPPFALTRASAIAPVTFSVDPVIPTSSAAPSPPIPALPIDTGSPSVSPGPGSGNSKPPNDGNSDPPTLGNSDPPGPGSGNSEPPNDDNPNPPSIGNSDLPKSDPSQIADPSRPADPPQSPNPPQNPAAVQSSVTNFSPKTPLKQPTPSSAVSVPAANSVYIDPQPQASKSSDVPLPVTVGGELVTPVAGSSGVVIFRSQTLTQEQTLTAIAGVPISLNSGSVFINGQGAPIPTAPTPTAVQGVQTPQAVPASPIVLGGQTASIVNPSAIIIGSQTAVLNQPAITISGTPVSLGTAGVVLGNSKAIPIFMSVAATAPPIATIAGQAITALPGQSGQVIAFDGTTLTPNSPGLTISGTPISLGPSGVLVIGSSTVTLPTPTPTATPVPTYIQIGRQTIGIESSAIIIAGTTLRPGSPGVTVDGTLVSLGSSMLVIGSRTATLAVPIPTTDAQTSDAGGLGPLIMSGFGQVGGVPASSTSAVHGSSGLVSGGNGSEYGTPFTGGAAGAGRRLRGGMGSWLWGSFGGLCLVLIGWIW